MRLLLTALLTALLSPGIVLPVSPAPATAAPTAPQGTGEIGFEARTVADGLRGGYQVIAADLNGDRRPDLIALGSGMEELVWFENPGWRRHVIATGLAGMINAAAHDLDGDGTPELALAHGFATTPQRSAGHVSILTRASEPSTSWSIREIDRVPTAHRLRWIEPAGGGARLINAPLVGEGAAPPDYDGNTPIFVYEPNDWSRSVVSDREEGVVHGIEVVERGDGRPGQMLLSAGFSGIHAYRYGDGEWHRVRIHRGDSTPAPAGGASEIAVGSVAGERFFATIEPWHGHQLVVYAPVTEEASREGAARSEGAGGWARRVVDDGLSDAHALLAVDLDADGVDELVVGERRGARVGVYKAAGGWARWSRQDLDDGEMAAAGCVAADLDLDGRVDIACIGTGTANLKWYRNLGAR